MDNIMDLNALSLFNNLTDEDFIAIHEAGQLKNLCYALSFDLQKINTQDKLLN
tara:strand:+ start:642 stop:800 length:159 start_codon:yes stop_codon:yes gene_type:complete